MELLEAWGVPVLAGKLENLDVEQAYEYVAAQHFEYTGEGSGGCQTANNHLLDDEELHDVRELILLHSKLYLDCLGHEYEDLFVCNSWGMKLKPYENIVPHRHTNSYISGVLYLTTGQPLHLHRPWDTHEMFMLTPNIPFDAENGLTQSTKQFHPEPCSCIIMPSGLTHHVGAVAKSKVDDRYSIAFNILPLGEFGHNGKLVSFEGKGYD